MCTAQEEKKCGEHKEGLKMWCKECNGLICAICAFGNQHKGHLVQFVGEARASFDQQVDDFLKKLNDDHIKTVEKVQELEKGILEMEKVRFLIFVL